MTKPRDMTTATLARFCLRSAAQVLEPCRSEIEELARRCVELETECERLKSWGANMRRVANAADNKAREVIESHSNRALREQLAAALRVVDVARECADWIEHDKRAAHRDLEVALVEAVHALDGKVNSPAKEQTDPDCRCRCHGNLTHETFCCIDCDRFHAYEPCECGHNMRWECQRAQVHLSSKRASERP